uniref:Chorein_N domain-containing protein n=1 Tax=Syphacia muris TaxID=451379 RepID=A0A0N5ABT9_9BILA
MCEELRKYKEKMPGFIFARNITADQIDVKILSGKGELKNIELNELVLTEVLELPTWLQIRRAHCNSVIIIVPWTGLRTTPIKLFIDEIQVEVALTADPPVPSGTNPLSTFGDNSYGFANRVVEGMSLYINMVEIHFDSGSFGGSFMLSRLCVESRSPAWLRIRDLRASRITDSVTNQVLMFKQLSWELLRVEAFAHAEHSQRTNISASLRLITNSGKGRFTIKKSTVDGSVLDGKIEIILDDILWIATLPQVRSAIAFYSHILNLIKAAPPKPRTVRHVGIVKTQAANKLTPTSNLASKAFKNFDFEQTSMHLYVGKIDLHLCDDTSATSGFPVDWNIESGALQVTLIRLSIDFYPANVACSDRTSWNRYTVPNECSTWNKKIVDAHLARLCSHLDANAQTRLKRIWPQLLSQNYVLRIYDVIVQCVTDANSKRDGLLNLFMSDRKSKASLPSDQPLIHLELASFYHRATENMPTMPNTVHLLVAPFILLWDQRTIRWVAFVIQDISSAVQNAGAAFDVDDIPNSNVRIDFLMPKVVIPLCSSLINDHRYPQRLLISMSTVLITNCGSLHSEDSSSFFKSLSSNLLDLVNKMEVNVNRVSFRNFIIHLNDTIADSEDDERFWISTSPVWVDTDNGEGTQFTPFFGDVAFHAVVQLSPNQVVFFEHFSG